MRFDKKALLVYAITDRSWLGQQTLEEQVEEALQGGTTCLQLREKDLEEELFLEEAINIKALCKEYNVPFLINDNVELAVSCDADGVHVGQNDLPVEKVREMIGPEKILGVSAQTVAQAIDAEKKGADYLGVGAVFATSTKADADTVDRETVKEICKSVSIPVVAIGGITKQNILELKGTGIDGVSIISAIFGSGRIKETCEEFVVLAKEMVEA